MTGGARTRAIEIWLRDMVEPYCSVSRGHNVGCRSIYFWLVIRAALSHDYRKLGDHSLAVLFDGRWHWLARACSVADAMRLDLHASAVQAHTDNAGLFRIFKRLWVVDDSIKVYQYGSLLVRQVSFGNCETM